MKQLPPGLTSYKRTPEFSEATIPAGLLREHKTRAGVWGRIHVTSGSLRYRILEPTLEEHILDEATFGIVEPDVLHEVEAIGRVRFFVEFLRSS